MQYKNVWIELIIFLIGIVHYQTSLIDTTAAVHIHFTYANKVVQLISYYLLHGLIAKLSSIFNQCISLNL